MRQHKNILIISTLFTAIVSALMIATPVSAQDQEREAVRKKIESLLQHAERLQDEGAGDRAEQLVNQARELEARLDRGRDRERPRRDGNEIEEIYHGLKVGAASLRALGRNEEAAHMENIAREILERARRGNQREEGERREREGEHREREEGERREREGEHREREEGERREREGEHREREEGERRERAKQLEDEVAELEKELERRLIELKKLELRRDR